MLGKQIDESIWQQILHVCPPEIEQVLHGLPVDTRSRIEELRFRIGQPLQLCGESVEGFLTPESQISIDPAKGLMVTAVQLSRVVQAVSQSSLYAVEDELRRGFITMPGGHRVGVAGRVVVYEDGHIRSIRSITSVNLRIAKERVGVADRIRPYLYRKQDGQPYSTLVLSPPQCGKTTLLRDLVRQWSENLVRANGRAMKVAVIDERSELAGCIEGIPQFSLGPRTDVLDACPKAEGLLMAIRSLSPDIVVTDEIGRAADRDAILEAVHAGVTVLASAHAHHLDEWRRRPYMDELFSLQVFSRYVVLNRQHGPGTVESVLDQQGQPIYTQATKTKGMERL